MAKIVCKICGGSTQIPDGEFEVQCDYCGYILNNPDQADPDESFPPMDEIPMNTGVPPKAAAQEQSSQQEDTFDFLSEAVKCTRKLERAAQMRKFLKIGLPILLAVAALTGLIWWMTTFDATAWQIFLGVIVGVLIAAGGVISAIMLDDEDNPVPMIVFLVLTVINVLLMIFFAAGYGIFGGIASIGLAIALGALTLAMNDGLDPWGCVAAFGMAVNILIATSLAGVTVLWIGLIVVLAILCAALIIPFADDDASIAAGAFMLILLAVVFGGGHFFLTDYMHMVHEVPVLAEMELQTEDEAVTVCSCGSYVNIPWWLYDWMHSSHCTTDRQMISVDGQYHYQPCSCGSYFDYEPHTYTDADEHGTKVCSSCGYVSKTAEQP